MFTGPPAYQSFGRSRISRRSPITPNIRIGPTFCELMKMANSVAAAMKMAAGSLIGGELLGRGVISSGIEVVDQPEALQHQSLVHELDDRCLGRDQAAEPPGALPPGFSPRSFLMRATMPSTCAVKPKMMPACILSAVVRPITLGGALSSTRCSRAARS